MIPVEIWKTQAHVRPMMHCEIISCCSVPPSCSAMKINNLKLVNEIGIHRALPRAKNDNNIDSDFLPIILPRHFSSRLWLWLCV